MTFQAHTMPFFVRFLLEGYLTRFSALGLDVEGILRISGSLPEIIAMKKSLVKGKCASYSQNMSFMPVAFGFFLTIRFACLYFVFWQEMLAICPRWMFMLPLVC